jgi:hypothetical protein
LRKSKTILMTWKHGIPKTVDNQLKRIARKEAKEIVKHFRTRGHGWPIDFSHLASDLMFQRYKVDSWAVMLGALYETGFKFELVSRDNKFLLVKENRRGLQKSKRKRRV